MIRKDDEILQGRRAGCRDALMHGGLAPDQAERWCAAWEAEATRQGVVRGPYYWDAGRGWIDAQRAFLEERDAGRRLMLLAMPAAHRLPAPHESPVGAMPTFALRARGRSPSARD